MEHSYQTVKLVVIAIEHLINNKMEKDRRFAQSIFAYRILKKDNKGVIL